MNTATMDSIPHSTDLSQHKNQTPDRAGGGFNKRILQGALFLADVRAMLEAEPPDTMERREQWRRFYEYCLNPSDIDFELKKLAAYSIFQSVNEWDKKLNRYPDTICERKAASNAGEYAERATPDREALAQYIGLDFTLYAQEETQDGKRKFRDWQGGREWNKDNSKIATLEELEIALRGGIALFAFFPSEKGFVCFDVDVGHSSGKDGFKSIERFLKRRGLTVNPFELAVVTVDTPSGGKHLYFRDWTSGTSKYDKEPLKGVEVFGKGIGTPLTAAGSVKKGKVYRLHGRLEDATNLPNALVDHIREKKGVGANRGPQYPQYPTKSSYSHTGKKNRGDYPLEQLVEWGIENANSDSRHINAFYVGLSVGNAYPLSEVKAACYRNGKFADRRDFSDSELEYQLNRGIAKSDYK